MLKEKLAKIHFNQENINIICKCAVAAYEEKLIIYFSDTITIFKPLRIVICNRKQGRIQWVLLLNLLQLPLYHYSDLILVHAEQTPFYSMRILLIFTNRDGRKGLESPQQREKHRYTFCLLAGQSPWSCRVISASLRNEVRRVRHDLSVLLFIYRLFHGKNKNQKKKDGRLFPF